MIKYRNIVTGRVVGVLEPEERRAELERVRKMGRPLKPNRIKVETKRREETITKLGRGRKWARVSDSTPLGYGEPAPVEPPAEDSRPESDPEQDTPDEALAVECREAGGGWYEIVAGGEVLERVRGREAAEAARDSAAAELAGA